MGTIITEWQNEKQGMEWQLIRMIRVIDDEGVIIDGWNEIIDTRKEYN